MASYTLTTQFIAQSLFGGGAVIGFLVSVSTVRRVYEDGIGLLPARFIPVAEKQQRRAGIAHMIISSLFGGVVVTTLGVVGVPLSNIIFGFFPSVFLSCGFSSLITLAVLYVLLNAFELGTAEQKDIVLRHAMFVGAGYTVFLLVSVLVGS